MKISSSINGYEGSFLEFHAGKMITEKQISFPKGTKIEVEDLFYNTPARFKHLSSDASELSHIVQYVNKCALANPNISFILSNNDKVVFSTDGSGNFEEIIASVYGKDVAKNMLTFNASNAMYKINGFTSSNSVFRSNRNNIVILINQRVIKNQNLIYAITDAYKTILPVGKYPITILQIECDPTIVDVNVHPTKQEVRFTDEFVLRNLITKTISETLTSVELVYRASTYEEPKTTYSTPYTPSYSYTPSYNTKEAPKQSSFSWDDFDDEDDDVKVENIQPIVKEEKVIDYIEPVVAVKQEFDLRESESNFFKSLNYIGQYNLTYLILEKEDNLYLLDQHACMERVMYEKIYSSFENETNEFYELLVPLKMELSSSEIILIDDKTKELEKLGITFEHFGNNTVLVRTLPLWVPEKLQMEFMSDIFSHILTSRFIAKNVLYDSLAKSLSCKKSIKANMAILKEEVQTLLEDLDNCKNPFTCPHGRPTIVHFTKYEIEKLFKRVI